MKYKRIAAVVLAASMVAGNGMAAFAADANGAEGEGTLIPHLDREITAVTLPTDSAVAHVFDYYVDPEQLIKDAGKLIGKDSVIGVDGDTNGVYFANAGTAAVSGTVSSTIAADTNNDYIVTVGDLTTNAEYKYDGTNWQVKKEDGSYENTTVNIDVKESDNSTTGTLAANDTVTVSGAVPAGAGGYSSNSDVVKFKGQNSVDVDVTVTATVAASEGGKDIALVADETALTAATTPALLMTLKVGSDSKAITSDGATVKAKIEGVANNFEVTVGKDTQNKDTYKYAPKANVDDSTWKSATVQLVGKTNKKNVEEGMTVPKLTLTWSVAKHADYTDTTAHGSWSGTSLWLAKDASTGFSTEGLIVEVSDGGITYKALASDKYEINDAGWVSTTWANIVEGIGSEPTKAYIRITDGNTRYIFEN